MNSNQFEEDDCWEKLQLKIEAKKERQKHILDAIKAAISLHEQKYHSKEE